MKLEERIKDRIIVYKFRPQKEIALELAILYLALAERRISRIRVAEACCQCIGWLKKAELPAPDYIEHLSCWMQRQKLRELLYPEKDNAVEQGGEGK